MWDRCGTDTKLHLSQINSELVLLSAPWDRWTDVLATKEFNFFSFNRNTYVVVNLKYLKVLEKIICPSVPPTALSSFRAVLARDRCGTDRDRYLSHCKQKATLTVAKKDITIEHNLCDITKSL